MPRPAAVPEDLTETLIERLVDLFYERIRADAVLGPIFERQIGDRWDAHLAAMTDFWSSVALMSGRYAGKPHAAHRPLGLSPAHFERWLGLFEMTVEGVCRGEAAEFLIGRAHRIADSLQIGLNIGPKALERPKVLGRPERQLAAPP